MSCGLLTRLTNTDSRRWQVNRVVINRKPTPRKPCKNEDCEKLEITFGYCGFCYAKEVQKAHEQAKKSTLRFGRIRHDQGRHLG